MCRDGGFFFLEVDIMVNVELEVFKFELAICCNLKEMVFFFCNCVLMKWVMLFCSLK